MKNKIVEQISIAQTKFSITSKAKELLQNYLQALEKKFRMNENKDVIEDIHIRIAEHLSNLAKTLKSNVLTEDEIAYVINKTGGSETISFSPNSNIRKWSTKRIAMLILKIIAYLTFWVPHLIWGLFALNGAFILLVFILSGPENLTPAVLSTYLGALLLPTLGIILGIILTIRKNLKGMYLFFLGIEVPLFLLSIFRIFALQIISPALSFIYILIIFSCITLTIDIIGFGKNLKLNRIFAYIKLAGYTTGAILSGYVLSIWLFFFPYFLSALHIFITQYIFEELIFQSPNPYQDPTNIFRSMLFVPIILIGFLVFLLFYLSPVYAFLIYTAKFVKNIYAVGVNLFKLNKSNTLKFEKEGPTLSNLFKLLIPILSITIIILAIILFSSKPSKKYNEEIKSTIEHDGNFEEKKSAYSILYKSENMVRKNIVSKLLSRYQFLFDENSTDMFYDLYCNKPNYLYGSNSIRNNNPGFALDKSFCNQLYELFEIVTYPVVYDGNISKDFKNSQIEYQKIFDDNIQRAEKRVINQYAADTLTESVFSGRWDFDDSVGLKDEDKKSVYLESVDVNTLIDTENNFHTSTYTFTFKNKEITNQEIYIEFTLPQDSVITDLKLGTELQNLGIVAPKQAASSVYEQSLKRAIDPALLEMIGPRTYRLRVYPIPPKGGDQQTNWNPDTGKSEIIQIPDFQRVQFTFSGVISSQYDLLVFPYTRNLDLSKTKLSAELNYYPHTNNNLEITGYAKGLIKNDRLLNPNSTKNDKYFKKEPMLSITGFDSKCEDTSANTDKAKIYLDVSRSMNKEQVHKTIGQILQGISSQYSTQNFEIREFNNVVSATKTISRSNIDSYIDGLELWGYSDKSQIIKTILEDSKDTSNLVFIVTDELMIRILNLAKKVIINTHIKRFKMT